MQLCNEMLVGINETSCQFFEESSQMPWMKVLCNLRCRSIVEGKSLKTLEPTMVESNAENLDRLITFSLRIAPSSRAAEVRKHEEVITCSFFAVSRVRSDSLRKYKRTRAKQQQLPSIGKLGAINRRWHEQLERSDSTLCRTSGRTISARNRTSRGKWS